ncbi:MAG: DUF1211 domain-containing protein [Anaerolineae bacterium]|nr:DUF1211 domain-containing protein [Anaerolineae bacterium]
MQLNYNRIAGQSLERLAALSDGIFAIAMTLLVFDLRLTINPYQAAQFNFLTTNPYPLWIRPDLQFQYERVFWDSIIAFAPHLLVYLMSFLTLGIFWLGQQTQLSQFERSDRDLTWMHLIFLFGVSMLPFSTRLLAENMNFRSALIVYWLNLLLLGVMLYRSMRYAWNAQLVKATTTPDMSTATTRRIENYQILYAFGMLLCIVSINWSIVFIVLVQLNAAIAPRVRWLGGL